MQNSLAKIQQVWAGFLREIFGEMFCLDLQS